MDGRLRAGLGGQGLSDIAVDSLRFAAMGTRVELHRFGDGADDALARARAAIEAVDDALTIHRPSPATALNATLMAGARAAIDDPILLDALVLVAEAHDATAGLFDPAADTRTGMRWGMLAFDPARATVTPARPLALDFGGFGKGFALDRAAAAMKGAGIACAFLSAGESSVAVVGGHPLGGGWPVAVPHPTLPDEVLAEFELRDAALSISSTLGSETRAPMVRPDDGAIVAAPRTAVAVEASGALAEAMSTALLVAEAGAADGLMRGGRDRRLRFDFPRAAAMPLAPVRAA